MSTAFRFRPTATSEVAFRSAAGAMLEAAQTHKGVLVKHGLSMSLLVELEQKLDQFDAAVRLGAEGRIRHTAATRELVALTKDAGRVVRAMDPGIRARLRNDLPALEQWASARAVLGTPQRSHGQGAETPALEAGGEVRPAA